MRRYGFPTYAEEYHQEQEESALHELDETVSLVVDLFEERKGAISFALEDEQDGDVELDDVHSVWFLGGEVPFEFASQDVLQFAKAIVGGLVAAVGQILADS